MTTNTTEPAVGRSRALQARELFEGHLMPCQALGVSADGHPAHELRLRRDARFSDASADSGSRPPGAMGPAVVSRSRRIHTTSIEGDLGHDFASQP
jgi:hypothetical protein